MNSGAEPTGALQARVFEPETVRVVDHAAGLGLSIEPLEFPDGTRTADDAAQAIGCTVSQIVKSLAFIVEGDDAAEGDDSADGGGESGSESGGGGGGAGGGQMVIALVSGANRLDAEALARAAGRPDAKVKQAKPDRVRETTGFPVGGVPPFGHSRTLATFVDPDLFDHEVVWAAAGTPSTVFAISPTDLVKATAATSL